MVESRNSDSEVCLDWTVFTRQKNSRESKRKQMVRTEYHAEDVSFVSSMAVPVVKMSHVKADTMYKDAVRPNTARKPNGDAARCPVIMFPSIPAAILQEFVNARTRPASLAAISCTYEWNPG